MNRSGRRAAELRAIGHRARQVGVLAVLVGSVTGIGVATFDRVVAEGMLDRLLDAPLWVQAIAPAVGLSLAAASLRWFAGRASPTTADEYIRNFHDPDQRLDLRPVAGRITASAATLGGGAAMGFEGPSIYLGAAVGSWVQRRFSRFFARNDAKLLMVCGAAAGVAAIFKAPATGLVFALEVPYRQDLARRMMLPAMFAAASSYVVYVALNGTAPLFPVSGAPPFDLRDLGGAAAIGFLCGGLARLFAAAQRVAKAVAARVPAVPRVAGAGLALVGTLGLSRAATGESLSIGSGYATIDWALDGRHALPVILAVFVIRAAATTFAVGGGGAGGLFVPLVVQGAVLGAAVSAAVGAHDTTLFPLLGVAAFLGAGYRVPLAAVVFVAESTGQPGFVVPGLIAAATSQLLMGDASVSSYQRDVRTGMLARRLALPVSAALRTDAATVPSDATIAELFAHHISELRLRSIPVVDRTAVVGMVVLDDVVRLPHDRWDATTAGELARPWPVIEVTATLADAMGTMERDDVDRLVVCDGGGFVGIVTSREILKLDAIMETAESEGLAPGTEAVSRTPSGDRARRDRRPPPPRGRQDPRGRAPRP